MEPHGPAPENRLAREKSPYLLQHARNPVDWYPWGEEAFAAARERDVPVFLSIGYSTCHWCHVMERESFEDAGVAALLNAHFVPVKVDREERPDVDQFYMTAAQAMGVGGGWPLNLFLTPALAPFGGGTYIPPVTRGGRTGMTELLPRVAGVWRERRDAIVDDGGRVLAHLGAIDAPREPAGPAAQLAADCEVLLERAHDPWHGGFGDAPKFPSPANLAFLARRWAADPGARSGALDLVRGQLDAMISGGIHDHLGGGFHRYATDRAWLVPHFEKMLYDQALVADALLDAYLATSEARYARAARATFAYLRRDLLAEGGAFCSAEDADSEGEEGRFYVWTPAQLEHALGAGDARLAAHHWGVTPQGNFEHGASILHAAQPLAATARAFGLDEAAAAERIERARVVLLAARASRVRPHRDDKVIAAWNGLAIAALARGARALGDPALAHAAERAATFVWVQLRDPGSGALRRRWREGEAALAGQLDDHANVARGCLELFAALHDPVWLERAVALTDAMLAAFWDDAQGALFAGPAGGPGEPAPPVRLKEGHDGAELAGASVAAANLLRLSALLPREDLRVKAERLLDYYARRLSGGAWAMPQMLVGMDLAARPPRHVVIAGEPSPERDALLAVYETRFRPFDDLVVVEERTRAALAALAPFTAALGPVDGRATAYVCVDHACRLPVGDPEAFAAALDDDDRAARDGRES